MSTRTATLGLTILFIISLVIRQSSGKSPTLRDNLELAQRCCPDSDLLLRNCTGGLKCEHGAYIIDPDSDPNDEFHIFADGRMMVFTEVIAHDQYCIGRLDRDDDEDENKFVAKVCFSQPEASKLSLFTLKGILSLISVLFLGLTIYVYNLIVMRDTQDRVVRIALVCLLVFYLGLGMIQCFPSVLGPTFLCSLTAIVVHFASVAYFAWINMVMANVWKSVVVPRWSIDESSWYRWNHIYGWSVPILIETVLLFGHFTQDETLNPGLGVQSCWFKTETQTLWYLYIPISVMIFINVALFCWTCVVLHRHGHDFNPERRNSLKYRVMMYLRLFLIVGLIWIFEVVSFMAGEHEIWILFDVINALQGFLLFLALVVFRSRVKRELAGKKICGCLHAPEHWRDHEDVEHQRLNENDDEGTLQFGISTTNGRHSEDKI